ncbi:MAG TPA: nuclear transport factor 2 family protein [Chryseolinea sp.]|nr:nuclear transport factor 2 family protein [Chryseolinea sp.]
MKSHNVILLATALAFGCEVKTNAVVTSAPSEEKTKEVLDHHWTAFQANDLEATMADYAEESVLITPDKTFKGLTEIRDNFVFAFAIFPKDSTTFQLDKSIINQDVGYIIWQAKSPKINLTFGTDTFIIRDGKIVRQTYAGVAAP